MSRAFASALVLSLGITACTNKVALDTTDQGIISDRPISREKMLATIKLSVPALLENAKFKDGKVEIDPELLQLIAMEQLQFEEELKKISPEIKVLNRYRMVFNGLAIVAPWSAREQLSRLQGVRQVELAREIQRPKPAQTGVGKTGGELENHNSVTFIQARKIHEELNVRGQGMRIGVIDSGIDYTHSMLGGSGNAEQFKSIDPGQANEAFPNKKVVGGRDFVGTTYNAASEIFANQIPQPDENPIDEGAHGTHVSGTIAGLGDGVNTYSGVAPEAQLYALKVFGAGGSTNDFVVVAALEYAADPNADGDPSDRLDVVNLSLGGGFGQPQTLYTEAINNLTRGQTVVVASAGNAGDVPYVVGAPSTSDAALSVAASIDDMPHNWQYPAVKFSSADHPEQLARAVEGNMSKPIDQIDDVTGELAYIGMGDQQTPDEIADQVKGKVAFIDRGKVTFAVKLALAEAAGAIGVVVANNQPGDPIAMGGPAQVAIPAIMITQELGQTIKEDLKKGPVTIQFKTGKKIELPQRIDTLTDFTSRGPRSIDALIKPEIAAPGENVISAEMGTGNKGIKFSGTSMSGPHMAGVMALLKQHRPNLSVKELKSLAITTARPLKDSKDQLYPISLQGAGRVQAYDAAVATVVVDQPTVSLGIVQIGDRKLIRRRLEVRNLTDADLTVAVSAISRQLNISAPDKITVKAGESAPLPLAILVQAASSDQAVLEMEGELQLRVSESQTLRVPVLAVATRLSDIAVGDLTIRAASEIDSVGAAVDLQLVNRSPQAGDAQIFNLLGRDHRKRSKGNTESYMSRGCDLESAGYRVVRKDVKGEPVEMLQVAMKLFESLTTWHYCQLSVQIDSSNDQLADQELVGIHGSMLAGTQGLDFISLLVDAVKAREIRRRFETELAEGKEPELDYTEALQEGRPMKIYNHSSLTIVETPLAALRRRATGELAIKVAALNVDQDALEPDDFLSSQIKIWKKLDPRSAQMGYYEIPETVALAGHQSATVSFTKGARQEKLVVYFPQNLGNRSIGGDDQTAIPKPKYSLLDQGALKQR